MQSSELCPVWRWPTQLLSSVLASLQKMIRAWLLWVVTAGPIPSHIAFIMDGNRRFADRLHIDRHIGHSHGYDALLRTLKDCFDLRVKTVTLYAFSIDNFQRPSDEVSALMLLMQSKLEALIEKEGLASAYGIRVKVLGDLSLLPDGARTAAEKAMAVTCKNSSHVLNLCISYTSTHEIAQSVQETCSNALKALGDDEHGCDADLGSGNAVMCGCKVQDVPAISSSHMSKCRCAQDYNCKDTDGLSELSSSDAPNGKQDFLLEQNLEEGGGDNAGNSGLVYGNGHHSVVVGKNHGACTYENGEANVGNAMAGELMHVCSGEKSCLAKYTCGEHCRTDDRLLKLVEESVSEEEIEKNLYTGPSCPPPDLLIRTSGETRLSNFLLWQASFSHLAFCKVLWPEFSFWHLFLIILEYQRSLPILLSKWQQNHETASHRKQHLLSERHTHSRKSD